MTCRSDASAGPAVSADALEAAREFIQRTRCPTFVDDDGWFPIRPTELAAFLTTLTAQVRALSVSEAEATRLKAEDALMRDGSKD